MRIWFSGTEKSRHDALKRSRALMTALMMVWGMGMGWPEEYCASYNDMAARSRKRVGRIRWVGGERSVMEKRMPLLGGR